MPFTPFSNARLEGLLLSFPVSPQGRTYIAQALAAPHRNAIGTTKNVVTDFPCPKMSMNIQSELKTVHAPLIRERVFSSQVIGYVTFPPPLELSYRSSKDKAVRTRRQIDCLVFDSQAGVQLETWARPKKAASDDEEEEAPDSALLAIADAAKKLGFSYRNVAAGSISDVRERNYKYLWSYLYRQAAKHHSAQVPELLRLFGNEECVFYSDLEQRRADVDLLHWAIAHGHLHMDFDAAELGQANDKILLFRHHEGLKAWQLTHDSATARPVPESDSRANELRNGDLISFDGKPLTVCFVGNTAIHAVDVSGGYVELLLPMLTSRRLVLPERLSKPAAPGPLWRASPRQCQAAITALLILQKIEHGEPLEITEQRSDSTIRRWKKTIREGIATGMAAIEALVDHSDQRGFHGSHIDLQLSQDINDLIRERQKDKKKQSVLSAYTAIETTIGGSGRKMIAKSSFYERWNRLRDLASISAQEGHKAAHKHSPVYWQLHLDTPVHARRALELVHLDSTLLDIVVISSLSGEVLGRPWLTLALCTATRRVVGMHLSFRPPSYISSMSVLADIVRRFGRLPDAVIHDWGSEFKAKDFKHALTALFIERHIRPKGAARFGSCLERMFGITLTELVHNCAGNTKMTKRVRELTKHVDPSIHSGLMLLDLLEALETYFFREYDTRKHPATLCPPRDGFNASLLIDGLRAHRIANLESILPLLSPYARSKPATVDRTRGVYVNGQYYGHPLFADSCASQHVMLKPLVGDPSVIFAFIAGEWRACRASSYTEVQHLTAGAKHCLYEELWLEHKLVVASHSEARSKVRALLDSINQKALENKEYFRDRSAMQMMAVASVNTKEADRPPPASANRFSDLISYAASEVLRGNQYGDLVGESA